MKKEVASDPDPTQAPAVASCCICLEEGPDEDGQPLLRSCACRGDSAGYGHISCIIKYAKSKTEEILKKERRGVRQIVLDSAWNAWTSCLTCKQEYEGEMRHAIRMSFVDSTEHLAEGHGLRIMAWFSLANSFLKKRDYGEAERLYTYILDVARPDTGILYSGFYVEVYYMLGKTCDLSRKPVEALEYYEKATECMKDNNLEDTYGVHDILEHLKTRLGLVGALPDSLVERARRAIERETLNHGEDSKRVLHAKMTLANALLQQKEHLEGLKVGKEAVESAKRFLGPEHPYTADIEESLSGMKQVYLDYLRGGAR